MARASNGVMANETRMVPMKLGGIARMVLFGFLVPGVAAHMSWQSPPSPEGGAEPSSRSSQAKPRGGLKRFSPLSGTLVGGSPGLIAAKQMSPSAFPPVGP